MSIQEAQTRAANIRLITDREARQDAIDALRIDFLRYVEDYAPNESLSSYYDSDRCNQLATLARIILTLKDCFR